MDSLAYAHRRLQAALVEIDHLHEIEFAYPDSKEALQKLKRILESHLQIIEDAEGADPEQIKQTCCDALTRLFMYVPLLGFILRSTNVRNSFEVIRPLLRLSGDLLEHTTKTADRKTRLILSSEWDYSPFTYPNMPALSDFVLIGLPAPESSNPLLIPLAGHELGHNLWERKELHSKYLPIIKRQIIEIITKNKWIQYTNIFPQVTMPPNKLLEDVFAPETYAESIKWCTKQAAETFCDYIGLKLFGESYLRAFSYLLSPNSSMGRHPHYPSMGVRVRNLINAANQYSIPVPDQYDTFFKDGSPGQLSDSERFKLSLADETLVILQNDLVPEADDQIRVSNIHLFSKEEIERILKRFKHMIPAENCRCLADILNAGWRVYEQDDFWDDSLFTKEPNILRRKIKKERVLKELVLKNIEIFEMEQIKVEY